MMRNKDLSFYSYVIGLFILVLYSMGAYFLWNAAPQYLGLGVTVLGLWHVLTHRNVCHLSPIYCTAAFCLLFSVFWNIDAQGNVLNYYAGLLLTNIPPTLLLLSLPEVEKRRILSLFTHWMAWILGISLIGFILLFFIPLPSFGTISNSEVWDAYEYTNYLIVIKGAFYDIRFNSIFREPGHVAMIASFFLYANHYNFSKRENKVLLIASLFTFSLAGYVLLIMGYTLHFFTYDFNKKKIRKVLLWPVGLLIIWLGAITYNGGNNLLNTLIIERLAFDSDKGIKGNNRVSDQTDRTFEFAWRNGEIVGGIDSKTSSQLRDLGEIAGAGYKIYMLDKGIIGTVAVFLFYFLIAVKSPNRYYALGMLILYVLAFLQRAYPTWAAWIVPFICGVSNINIKKKR